MHPWVHSFYGGYVFKIIKIADMVQLLLLIGIAVCGIYYYVHPIERNKLKIKLYPVQAILERQALQCSEGAPEWLKHSIQSTTLTHHAPNNQIAYMSPEGELHHCESGYLGMPLLSDHVTAETRFRYASVSKLWTSDAILDLVKANKIQLDTAVLSGLPQLPHMKDSRIEQIQTRDLLLHRAGFKRTGLMGDEMFRTGQIPFCPTALDKLADYELAFVPSTEYSYSNLGYCLLGEVIAHQTQQSYTAWLEQHYQLQADGIRFLKNERYADEAKNRYITTSIMDYGDIYTAFDYPSLASSAGLSGSATALVHQVKKMVDKPMPNILSQPNAQCDLSKLRDCQGYAMFPYQAGPQQLKVYIRDGTLPSSTSVLMVDEKGGILALLASGRSKQGRSDHDQTKMMLYDALNAWYKP